MKAHLREGERHGVMEACLLCLKSYLDSISKGPVYSLFPLGELPSIEKVATLMGTLPELLEESEALHADVAETMAIHEGLREAALR